jgi:hypothetical protein
LILPVELCGLADCHNLRYNHWVPMLCVGTFFLISARK